jgi:hypothetical protein
MGTEVKANCGVCGEAGTVSFGGVMRSNKIKYCGAICPTCRKLITVDLRKEVACPTCGDTAVTLIGDETRVPGSHIPERSYFEAAAHRAEAWHAANKDRLTQEARDQKAEYRKRWAMHAKTGSGFIGELAKEVMAQSHRLDRSEEPTIPDTPWPMQGYPDAETWIEAQMAAVRAHTPERYEGRHRCPSCDSFELLFETTMHFD